ncbi:MAG TPA: ribbon-helix-helix protein, CopG family [Alloacidobacterium sp.]|nr:ribbon-helix-helix protein, CopG family [Alloacidobacterium sp.]
MVVTAKRRTFTISFPPDLAKQVEQLAAQESRTTSELFREAFRTYRAQQLRKTLLDLNEIARKDDHKGYTPDDIERLIDEVRASQSRRAG